MKQTLKLCIASPSFYPTYGGAQLRFLRYLPGLRERGIDPYVFTGTPNKKQMTDQEILKAWQKGRIGRLLEPEKINQTDVYRIRLPDKDNAWRAYLYYIGLIKFCLQQRFRPDVIQFVTNLRPPSIPWLLAMKSLGIRTVYSITLAPKLSSKAFKGAKQKFEFRTLFDQLNLIVTNNEPLSDIARSIGVRTTIEIIPNGVDLNKFSPGENTLSGTKIRANLGIRESDKVIITVGAVSPRKGSDILLEAWSRVINIYPNTHLILAGPRKDLEHEGKAEFRARIEKILEQIPQAKSYVHFLGSIDNVEEYLRIADIFVLPSEREGMPNSVLEAMATKIPVVMTPFVGLSDDLGKPNETFLLCEREAGDLTAALKRLLSDENLKNDLARRGYEWVASTMNLEKSLDQYADLYKRLARQDP